MFRHIIAVRQKFQTVLPRQIGDELFITIRLFPAQLVIEMNDRKNNPQLTAQLQQQSQKRNRIDPSRNGHTNAVSGPQRFIASDVADKLRR